MAELTSPRTGIGAREDRRALASDEQRFTELFERHRDDLCRYLYRQLRSQDAAEDAVALTFVKAWRAREGFRGQASCKTWLYQIANRVVLDEMRRRRRRPVEQELDIQQPELERLLQDEAPEPEEVLLRGERECLTRAAVQQALDRLTPDARELVNLYYFQGYNYDQISSRLGISYGRLRGRLHLIRERIRRDLTRRQQFSLADA